MPVWKRNIFVNAIKTRIELESRTAENIIEEYPALTTTEKAEILMTITTV